MKKRISALICLALAAVTALTMAVVSFAAGTYDAKEWVDTSKKCSLTLNYEGDGYVFAEKNVNIYKVASVSADMVYSLTEQFGDYKITFNKNMTQDDYADLASTVYGYAVGDSLVPTATDITDEDGKVCFENLEVGLYLISQVKEVANDTVYTFKEALIAVPMVGEDGIWNYDVAAKIKFETVPVPHTYTTYTMNIIWDDKGHEDERPEFVTVDIMRDGKKFDNVDVKAKDDWKYDWTVKDDVSTWAVASRNTPEGYTVKVHFVDEQCQIVYTYVEAPQTGDTSNVMFYAIGMLVAGSALAVAGAVMKRKTVKGE